MSLGLFLHISNTMPRTGDKDPYRPLLTNQKRVHSLLSHLHSKDNEPEISTDVVVEELSHRFSNIHGGRPMQVNIRLKLSLGLISFDSRNWLLSIWYNHFIHVVMINGKIRRRCSITNISFFELLNKIPEWKRFPHFNPINKIPEWQRFSHFNPII